MAASGGKLKGFFMISAALTAIVLMVLSATVVGLYSGVFSMLEGSRTASTAQQYAEIDANALTLLPYDELLSAVHGRSDIEGADGWQSEVTIGAEKIIGEDSRQRIGEVKVYKSGEGTSRASLQVPLSSQVGGAFQQDFSQNGYTKLPNGLIIQWGVGAASSWTAFPISFPNSLLQIVASNRSGRGSIGPAYTQATNSSCYVELHELDGGENRPGHAFGYIAIGY